MLVVFGDNPNKLTAAKEEHVKVHILNQAGAALCSCYARHRRQCTCSCCGVGAEPPTTSLWVNHWKELTHLHNLHRSIAVLQIPYWLPAASLLSESLFLHQGLSVNVICFKPGYRLVLLLLLLPSHFAPTYPWRWWLWKLGWDF
jgi:hypothetical protein